MAPGQMQRNLQSVDLIPDNNTQTNVRKVQFIDVGEHILLVVELPASQKVLRFRKEGFYGALMDLQLGKIVNSHEQHEQEKAS